ncbi:DUF5655 domain-containing protein [Pseudoflavonifractor phocaeensis]|uniref:DUF5655 domain-containing protein n=1 Tax=Pseudoflavonifractor phocaeensis TaxID=1870988 RepID=UPI00195CFD55|nr:DUF5655 domain-containing protein [Pseudoflavonifractor phocaeensis]MBM6722981.1 hypothetical protein [Pseudoflavonifractor phocaeensis]
METSPYYAADLGLYFTGRPLELALYEALFHTMDTAFPNGRVKVQKSQISFYGRHLFAAASLPVRRKKDWPEHCLLVTFGLEYPLSSPRIAVATEPYPNRWTHHVVVARPEDMDEELLGWLEEAWTFSEHKR